jgi:NADH dehydrogenase
MPNVVVIGGGFAGTTVVRRLERRVPPDWHVVLISNENYMVYTPLLPEVVGASLLPGHAVAPIRKMLQRTRYYRARVDAIDFNERVIHYSDRDSHSLSYDHLVLALGKVADIGFIDGMEEHALPLKTLGDALHIRNRILVRLEQAELEDNPQVRHSLTTFIVVGGGSSGVEVAGTIADFVHAARQFYPRTQQIDVRVIVLESSDRLVPEFPPALGESARRLMSRHGIEIHLGARVSKVTQDGVKTETGDWIRGGNVICTIGTAPNPLVEALGLPDRRGLINTAPDMSVPAAEGVWAVGDCAAIVNAQDNSLCPPMAQYAVREATQVADNIVRAVRGKTPRPFRYRSLGHLTSIGHRRAIAHVLGIRLTGFSAWLLWRGVYLSMLPTFLRKLQVFAEWNLELLFPRDVTQLHMARTLPRQATAPSRQEAPRPPGKAATG